MLFKGLFVYFLGIVAVSQCHYFYSGYHITFTKVWYDAEGPDDCKTAPEEVKTGELPIDKCDGAEAKDRKCWCVGYNILSTDPQYTPPDEIKYSPVCGDCVDPCALQFRLDPYAAYSVDDKKDDQEEANVDKEEANGAEEEVKVLEEERTSDKEEVTGDEEEVNGYKEETNGDEEEANVDKEERTSDKEQATGDKEEANGDEEEASANKEEANADEEKANADEDEPK